MLRGTSAGKARPGRDKVPSTKGAVHNPVRSGSPLVRTFPLVPKKKGTQYDRRKPPRRLEDYGVRSAKRCARTES